MLKVYGVAKSRTFRVLWLLEELSLKYEHIKVRFDKGEQQSKEFLHLNPSGKVPVLVDDGQVVLESPAILLHLHDRYGSGNAVFVKAEEQRSELYQWMFFGACELEQGLWTAAKHSFVLPPDKRMPGTVISGQEDFVKQLGYLHEMLGPKAFALGDRFTIADILICHILLWATQQQKLDLKYPNIRDYVDRCTARPQYVALVNKLKSQKNPDGTPK